MYDAAWDSDADNLYVLGIKPEGVISTNRTVSDADIGVTYNIFTTRELQQMGIGFVVRWRVATHWEVGGQWRYPAVNWAIDTPPASDGLPFYRVAAYSWDNGINGLFLQGGGAGNYNFYSIADYRNRLLSLFGKREGFATAFLYDAEVEVRYALIRNGDKIVVALDGIPKSITTSFITIRARPQSAIIADATIRQTIFLKPLPMGTCTTGNVVVPFGGGNESELPSITSTSISRPFDITLTNCPRVNIGYSFVAPGGIGYDDATGVVDLDSTPGNAQGIGVQISHRNDPVHNNDTIVFNPSDYITNPSYTRNWPQCQSQGTCTNSGTGVTHSIPMQAAVYRTGAVTPGKINASVLFHIVYP